MSLELLVILAADRAPTGSAWQKALEEQHGPVYSLGYEGHFLECASAFYAASTLVARFGGLAFDPQEANFMTELQLTDAAKRCLELAATE